MSTLAKNGISLQRTPSDSTLASSQDSHLATDDLESNPFENKISWDEFKRDYYKSEKKIKKELENLHIILIEFTKHISLTNPQSPHICSTGTLCKDFQNLSLQIKADLTQMANLFTSLKRNKAETDELIKQNMLKRFKEIHQDHEKEYARLNVRRALMVIYVEQEFF